MKKEKPEKIEEETRAEIVEENLRHSIDAGHDFVVRTKIVYDFVKQELTGKYLDMAIEDKSGATTINFRDLLREADKEEKGIVFVRGEVFALVEEPENSDNPVIEVGN